MSKGGFTLPGESGYEKLTLQMAEKWGADCIRDSDGTQLSQEIVESGIPIYSTICLVRSVNDWAKQHMNRLQRNFLMTAPVLALETDLQIDPLEGFFREQFTLCPDDDPKTWWQVYDRTENVEHKDWQFDGQRVHIKNARPYHLYTVSFLATRIWEEISMYNHITNDWGDREHLMAVEPRYPEVQAVLLDYLDQWCLAHPETKVVRFTSMFYNFVWLWGSDPRQRNIYTDWGSYDFTVNPVSLQAFEREYGYRMVAEDFINMGRLHSAHNPPTEKQRDWMEFTGKFVREFGRKCVDVVHRHGKLAYVFYDDSWIGVEPWNGHFGEFGFDGLIKCVFNAFEARLCAGVREVETHELRLHPYLFPTGLGGEPTFLPGGHPEEDARRFWSCVRRALLRVKIDRIGLGGYLHLVEEFPEFCDEIARIADEFRTLKAFHEAGAPWSSGIRVGILQSWGSLRTWNCAGHMHEHPELPLNHIYEALAGLPVELRALSLADVLADGVPDDIDVIINAGREGDAWSGGDIWQDSRLIAQINRFAAKGGGVIGVGEPSAARGGMRHLRMADILGVDREVGQTICFEKYHFETVSDHFIMRDASGAPAFHNHTPGVYALNGRTQVLAERDGDVTVAANQFGQGRSVYLSGFTYSGENTRMLYRAILWAAGREAAARQYMPESVACEAACFPASGKLVAINNSGVPVNTGIDLPEGRMTVSLLPWGIAILDCRN